MTRFFSAILVLALMTASPAPVTGQSIPDHIPDVPGESPADRAHERMIERHRGFLSRLFSTGSFDAAPVPAHGFAFQTNVAVGLDLRSGDAIFLAINSRQLPPERDPFERVEGAWIWYAGVGYTMSGTRFFGDSRAARRAAVTTELGAWSGATSVLALDVSPTYEILRGATWSVPAGVRLSVARMATEDASVVHPFLGFTIAAKFHFFARDRLELK